MRLISALILCLLLFTFSANVWAVSPNPQEEIHKRLQDSRSQEYLLLQEILQVDSRLQKVAGEKATLAAQQQQLKNELVLAQEKEKRLNLELASGRENFGRSLRFLQRYGASPYLMAAIFSTNLSDFFIRWELLQRYVGFLLARVRHQMALHNQAREAAAEVRNKESRVAQAAAQAASLEQELLSLKQARQAALDRIRQQTTNYQQTLLALEQAWQNALPALQALLNDFPHFSWQKLNPDRVQIDYSRGRILAEFSEGQINSVLLQGRDALRGVKFELIPGGLRIPGPDFRLQGTLAVAGPRHLAFAPQAVELAGLPLDRSTWDVLLPQPVFTIELPPPAFGLKYSNLEIQQGLMILELLPPSQHRIP